MSQSNTRDSLIQEARGWIGTPWHHHAALKSVGCDCVGLIRGAMLAIGMDVPTIPAYSRYPRDGTLLTFIDSVMRRVSLDDALQGDIVVLRVLREPQHLALLSYPDESGFRRIIHAHISHGVVETTFEADMVMCVYECPLQWQR